MHKDEREENEGGIAVYRSVKVYRIVSYLPTPGGRMKMKGDRELMGRGKGKGAARKGTPQNMKEDIRLRTWVDKPRLQWALAALRTLTLTLTPIPLHRIPFCSRGNPLLVPVTVGALLPPPKRPKLLQTPLLFT